MLAHTGSSNGPHRRDEGVCVGRERGAVYSGWSVLEKVATGRGQTRFALSLSIGWRICGLVRVACQNKAVVYDLLIKVSAETMLTIAADPKHLALEPGLQWAPYQVGHGSLNQIPAPSPSLA